MHPTTNKFKTFSTSSFILLKTTNKILQWALHVFETLKFNTLWIWAAFYPNKLLYENRTQCHSGNPFQNQLRKPQKLYQHRNTRTTVYSWLHETCAVYHIIYLFNKILYFKFFLLLDFQYKKVYTRSWYMFLHNKLCDYRKRHKTEKSNAVLSVNNFTHIKRDCEY